MRPLRPSLTALSSLPPLQLRHHAPRLSRRLVQSHGLDSLLFRDARPQPPPLIQRSSFSTTPTRRLAGDPNAPSDIASSIYEQRMQDAKRSHDGKPKLTLPYFSLHDRVVVITGGAQGLGLAMAWGVVSSGAHVALVDLDYEQIKDSAEHLKKRYRKEHENTSGSPRVTAHAADASSPDSVREAIESILDAHGGKIDHLITSAGIADNFPAEQYPYDKLQKVWAVNIDGTYLFAAEVAKHLMRRKAGGSMVFVGSMSGSIVNVPQPQAPYNAAKAAVRHLASSMAVEWADKGIRVNCVSPGYIETELTGSLLQEQPELKDQWLSKIPQQRLGTPEDLMGTVVFLLSDASRYVTGADIRVDGGYTLL